MDYYLLVWMIGGEVYNVPMVNNMRTNRQSYPKQCSKPYPQRLLAYPELLLLLEARMAWVTFCHGQCLD